MLRLVTFFLLLLHFSAAIAEDEWAMTCRLAYRALGGVEGPMTELKNAALESFAYELKQIVEQIPQKRREEFLKSLGDKIELLSEADYIKKYGETTQGHYDRLTKRIAISLKDEQLILDLSTLIHEIRHLADYANRGYLTKLLMKLFRSTTYIDERNAFGTNYAMVQGIALRLGSPEKFINLLAKESDFADVKNDILLLLRATKFSEKGKIVVTEENLLALFKEGNPNAKPSDVRKWKEGLLKRIQMKTWSKYLDLFQNLQLPQKEYIKTRLEGYAAKMRRERISNVVSYVIYSGVLYEILKNLIPIVHQLVGSVS
jgi:hypothetical protein